jgi:hypothetical protein
MGISFSINELKFHPTDISRILKSEISPILEMQKISPSQDNQEADR